MQLRCTESLSGQRNRQSCILWLAASGGWKQLPRRLRCHSNAHDYLVIITLKLPRDGFVALSPSWQQNNSMASADPQSEILAARPCPYSSALTAPRTGNQSQRRLVKAKIGSINRAPELAAATACTVAQLQPANFDLSDSCQIRRAPERSPSLFAGSCRAKCCTNSSAAQVSFKAV